MSTSDPDPDFTSQYNDTKSKADKGISTTTTIAIVIPVVIVALIIIFGIIVGVVIIRRRKRRRQQVEKNKEISHVYQAVNHGSDPEAYVGTFYSGNPYMGANGVYGGQGMGATQVQREIGGREIKEVSGDGVRGEADSREVRRPVEIP